MAKERALTPERVRECLLYEADTGEFVWRRSKGSVKSGKIAGSRDRAGYRRIKLDGDLWAAHRLAWFVTHGVWPRNEIDHINGDRADNRIVNLRDVTRTENLCNGHKVRGSVGVVGVSLFRGRYRARIWVDGKGTFLGSFDTPEEASAAYLAAKRVLHPSAPISQYEATGGVC